MGNVRAFLSKGQPQILRLAMLAQDDSHKLNILINLEVYRGCGDSSAG